MCRIAAYAGPEIPLENIIVRPVHSLLEQSQHATEAKFAVNGDGFGISWYDADGQLGLYRDVLPAWADDNLINLCRMVKSGLFTAHIRASTEGETSRANCHPFTYENWSFCHNGQVPHFKAVRRKLLAALPDHLFDLRRGSTDSELVFLTMLSHGLADDPRHAIRATISDFSHVGAAAPTKLTCVLSDGAKLYAFRHASSGSAPTLYVSGVLDHGGHALASEPLCGMSPRWTSVPQDTLCTMDESGFAMHPLADQVAA